MIANIVENDKEEEFPLASQTKTSTKMCIRKAYFQKQIERMAVNVSFAVPCGSMWSWENYRLLVFISGKKQINGIIACEKHRLFS